MLRNSGKTTGWILVAAGVMIGIGVSLWLWSGTRDDDLETSGAIFGMVLLFAVVVLPLTGLGIYLIAQGSRQETESANLDRQRTLLDAIATQGEVSITDLSLQLKVPRSEIERDLRTLVGLGLFSGYVDWNRGQLYSVEARKLQEMSTCPNCGGEMSMAGKGMIKCQFCGAEVFLT